MGADVDRNAGKSSPHAEGTSAPDSRAGPVVRRLASFGETLRAVAWSFFGVRRRDAHERDATRLHPLAVVMAGVALAALFVLVLLLIVHAVVR